MDITEVQDVTSSLAPLQEDTSGAFLFSCSFLTIQVDRVNAEEPQLFPCTSRQETVQILLPLIPQTRLLPKTSRTSEGHQDMLLTANTCFQ